MALTTYTELQAAIVAWANRTDLTALIPDFISLAEVRIWTSLRGKALVKDFSLPYLAAASSVDLPSDMISVLSLVDTSGARAGLITVLGNDRFAELQANPVMIDTTTTQMLNTGRTLYFVSVPSAAGTITGKYLAREPALSGSVATNYVLTNYPDLYLFGALLEVSDYLKDDAQILKYKTRFEMSMADANSQSGYMGQRPYISPSMTVV